jgi:hypothetical protein
MYFKTNKSEQHARFALQAALIRKHFPFLHCKFKGAELMCSGEIMPSDFCDTYRILIRYPKGKVPRVNIVRPKIEPSAKIHMYPNGALCLYDHRAAPWNANYNLHETIIPWTAEWLVFYELYKTHNVWLGPEAPHSADEAKEPQRDAA